MSKWFRVVDPLSPLRGCDVKGNIVELGKDTSWKWLLVESVRRVDVFVGDRPFQLVGSGDDLGVLIKISHLEESSIQDDVVEMTTDSPYGKCLSEDERTRKDGLTIRIAVFEKAAQIALEDLHGKLLATRTIRDNPKLAVDNALDMFEAGEDEDEIHNFLWAWENGNGES